MNPIRILVDSFADASLPNAQMGNAREIISRLDPDRFHISVFSVSAPDPRIQARANTRLIQLPARRRTVRILREFLTGSHHLLFYMKASPASRWYLGLRDRWRDRRITIGTVESQSDLRNEPTITAEAVKLWEQTVLRCDHLYSNSRAVQASLKREYDLPSEVVPTGVDTRFFVPDSTRAPNQRVRVLFAGSLRRFKQPQLLLDAAARFPRADFMIAGAGPMASLLSRRIASEGLRNAHLLGPLDAEQLKRQYQLADIFFFPSAWEGSPKVVLEAAACGLPVIVRGTYAPETVVHGVTGYQASCDQELFSYLSTLIANADLRSALAAAGRRHSQLFDWDLITARWAQEFIRLAGGGSSSLGKVS
jgi:glycosyltransferase involved in cell wall biosynthesis